MVYLSLTLFLYIFHFFCRWNKNLLNQVYYLALILLILFTVFRFQVGCDWYGYHQLFQRYSNPEFLPSAIKFEPISHLIFYFIYKSGLPYPYIYIPFGLVFFAGIHVLAKRQPDPLGFLLLLLPILIINIGMSAVRQAAAIGIICIALTAFIDRKPRLYLFWVIVSLGFHSSAIIFLLLIPFAGGRINNLRVSISLFIFLIIPLAFYILYNQNFIRINTEYIQSSREAFGAIFRLSVLFLSAFYFFLFLKNKWKNNFPKDYNLALLGSVSMILIIFFVPISSIISDRFGYYLIPIQAIIFARTFYLPFNSDRILHAILPYAGLFIVLALWTLTSDHYLKCYLPYKSWILGMPEGDMLK